LALLSIFRPKNLIAVECEPRLVEQLAQTLSEWPEVRVVNAALGAREGMATFYQLRHSAGSSLLQPRAEATKEFEEHSWDVVGNAQVRTVSYDELVADEESVSILKLDIQGFEKQVLSASRSGLLKTQSVIMEVTFIPHYEQDATFEELHVLMKDRGFGLYRLSPVYHRGGRALFADAVYVREQILRATQAS
jgi:FkbM family methyltransferase